MFLLGLAVSVKHKRITRPPPIVHLFPEPLFPLFHGASLCLQIYDNAMIAAGLSEDPRPMVSRLTELLTKALEKH